MFTQTGLGCIAEPRDQVIIGGQLLFPPLELAQRDPLIEQRLGDLLAQRQLGRGAEPRQQVVVDGNRLRTAVKRAKPDPFVEERPGDLLGSGAPAVSAQVDGVAL